jgi:large subunit ribosomal protein L10
MAKAGRLVKDLIVQELKRALKQSPSFFVASLGNLKAVEADALRKQLRPVQATLRVVRRTLGLQGVLPFQLNGAATRELFAGSVVFVLPSGEIIPAAKVVVQFAKAKEGKLLIRGGIVEGQLLGRAAFEEFASLPPRPQLVAQVVGAIEAPIAELIGCLEAFLGELAWILEAASKKRTAESSQPSAGGGQ